MFGLKVWVSFATGSSLMISLLPFVHGSRGLGLCFLFLISGNRGDCVNQFVSTYTE